MCGTEGGGGKDECWASVWIPNICLECWVMGKFFVVVTIQEEGMFRMSGSVAAPLRLDCKWTPTLAATCMSVACLSHVCHATHCIFRCSAHLSYKYVRAPVYVCGERNAMLVCDIVRDVDRLGMTVAPSTVYYLDTTLYSIYCSCGWLTSFQPLTTPLLVVVCGNYWTKFVRSL